jgi:hypothetical protein
MAQELMAKKRAALNRLKTALGHFTNHRLEVQRGFDRPRRVLQRHHPRRGRESWHGMSRQHCCGPCRLAKRKTRPGKRPETGAKSVDLRLPGSNPVPANKFEGSAAWRKVGSRPLTRRDGALGSHRKVQNQGPG